MSKFSTIFVVVGTPGSGKDLLVQAVNDMGSLHCRIVPKHTDRPRQSDDSTEMICIDDIDYDLDGCDIVYDNYENKYGIKLPLIFDQLAMGVSQVVVVSNIDAINQLKKCFSNQIKLVFVHSEMDEEQYRAEQRKLSKPKKYIEERVGKYRQALDIYYRNIASFDHVLIYSDSQEDLFDQIFRLFNYYE